MSRRALAALGAVLAATLAGCATAPPTLYHWGDYQRQIYQSLNADDSSPQEQLQQLQQQAEKARAGNAALPPGFRAHVGLLMLRLGRDADAAAQFQAEKQAFPESTAYMDFLLRRLQPAQAAAR
ncbi:DUF4810 domain-containing protein [Rubrivivax gelatinosus]|uniref:Lipoprotein n=1 Tax=Rubrivivax gelatinosus TaxID=28068 RepID=A0A4R2MG93_RUBGE|nr:DUF4810 domain-containing protein [Rubrivivax gelatinosus]MBK1688102.1 DUF4810 domain-containing protein [Rubrivivax gelatinosus]TCP03827.1 hypothetical protein EV684_10372 [Rubrivivax gelatinosus]